MMKGAKTDRRRTGAPQDFDRAYPHLARWVRDCGWVELGDDEGPLGRVRVLDAGGLIWEGLDRIDSLDAALAAADAAIAAWLADHGFAGTRS